MSSSTPGQDTSATTLPPSPLADALRVAPTPSGGSDSVRTTLVPSA